MKVQIKLLNGAELPKYQTSGAAGLDLRANDVRYSDEARLEAGSWVAVSIMPGQLMKFGTGISIAIPEGYEGQVRARSGLSNKHKLIIPNGVGSIDSDYRGEIQVGLLNLGTEPVTIHAGDRIAQLMICPVARVELEVVDALDETERGAGGFGHTGSR